MSCEQTKRRTVSSRTVLRGLTACLLVGAAVIHMLEVSEHFEVDPLYGWFFVVVAGGQTLAAGAMIFWRRRAVLYVVAMGNLGVIALWLLTRTAGVPLGIEAGVRQAAGQPDVAATLLEVASVLIAAYLLSAPLPGKRIPYPAGIALSVVGLVVSIAAVSWPVLGRREACAHFNPEYGPLEAVDGHSIMPRTNPKAQLSKGETKALLSGLIVNCGGEHVTLTGVEVVSDAGNAAQVLDTFVMPLQGGARLDAGEGPSLGNVAVPPTDDHSDLALYSRVKAVSYGSYSINGLRITYRYRGKPLAQVFATNVEIDIAGGP
jgi:hypothetical protein